MDTILSRLSRVRFLEERKGLFCVLRLNNQGDGLLSVGGGGHSSEPEYQFPHPRSERLGIVAENKTAYMYTMNESLVERGGKKKEKT